MDITIRIALATSAMVQLYTRLYTTYMEQQTNKLQIKAQSLSFS